MRPDWGALAERIRAGDQGAELELYQVVWRGGQFMLRRVVGQCEDLEDRLQELYLSLLGTIRAGKLEHPEALGGYIRSSLHIVAVNVIQERTQARLREIPVDALLNSRADHRMDPEEIALERERKEIMLSVLAGMKERDREVLFRFYLDGQPQERIEAEMQLSETQFRLLKSRAKARCAELGRKKRLAETRKFPGAVSTLFQTCASV